MIRLDSDDRKWFAFSIIIPVLAWWFLSGSKKYSSKGAR